MAGRIVEKRKFAKAVPSTCTKMYVRVYRDILFNVTAQVLYRVVHNSRRIVKKKRSKAFFVADIEIGNLPELHFYVTDDEDNYFKRSYVPMLVFYFFKNV